MSHRIKCVSYTKLFFIIYCDIWHMSSYVHIYDSHSQYFDHRSGALKGTPLLFAVTVIASFVHVLIFLDV
jgi:hypothetical protein